jgi:hypothetical protein
MELIRSLIMSEKPYNKVFAAQLLLSQQARTLQADDAEQWQLFASTTLLSGMAIGSANERR